MLLPTEHINIVNPGPNSGRGIYARAVAIRTREEWKNAREVADDMCEWFDEKNGNFPGEFSRAYAIAHSQVTDDKKPLRFFVVAKELYEDKEKGKREIENFAFEARAIFNCIMLETPAKIKRRMPERRVTTDKDGKARVAVSMTEKEVPNFIDLAEGCMSFPHRKEKNVQRYFRIFVQYQYFAKFLFWQRRKTFRGWVEGLKAHIIQHEVDHFNGKNIFYENKNA